MKLSVSSSLLAAVPKFKPSYRLFFLRLHNFLHVMADLKKNYDDLIIINLYSTKAIYLTNFISYYRVLRTEELIDDKDLPEEHKLRVLYIDYPMLPRTVIVVLKQKEKAIKKEIHTRRPVLSTDQSLPSCFYFRIS